MLNRLAERLGLKTRAFRLSLAVGLAAAALHVAVDTARFHTQRLERAGEAARTAAQLSARLIDSDIAERTQQLVAQVGQLNESSRSDLAPRLKNLAASAAAYSWIGVADRSGRVLAANDGLLVGANVAAREWFRYGSKALWHGDVHEAVLLSSLMQVRSDGEPWRFVDVALPVAGKDFEGVLGAHLSWSWLQARMRTLEPGLPSGSELMVVGADGRVVGAAVNGPALTFSSLKLARQGEPGWIVEAWTGQADGVTGYAKHTGFGSFRGMGWVTLVRVPVQRWSSAADQRLLQETLVSVCLAVIAAIVVGTVATSSQTRRRP